MWNFVSYVLERFPILPIVLKYTDTKPKQVHIYPTPRSIDRNDRNHRNHPKNIIVNSENTNPFNNGTFFIILQLMIITYVPFSSYLTPYYDPIVKQPIEELDFCQNMSNLDPQFNMLTPNINDYGHRLFPSLEAGY